MKNPVLYKKKYIYIETLYFLKIRNKKYRGKYKRQCTQKIRSKYYFLQVLVHVYREDRSVTKKILSIVYFLRRYNN